MPKRISVTKESQTGRNEQFKDNYENKLMNRTEFVKNIENGKYDNYHVRIINGVKTPVSNPDKTKNNNLDWFSKTKWYFLSQIFLLVQL